MLHNIVDSEKKCRRENRDVQQIIAIHLIRWCTISKIGVQEDVTNTASVGHRVISFPWDLALLFNYACPCVPFRLLYFYYVILLLFTALITAARTAFRLFWCLCGLLPPSFLYRHHHSHLCLLFWAALQHQLFTALLLFQFSLHHSFRHSWHISFYHTFSISSWI